MSKFEQLAQQLSTKQGVTDPKALAAAIGREKYGKKGMAAKSAAGRRKKKMMPEQRAKMMAKFMKDRNK
jgi:hypothetical protein